MNLKRQNPFGYFILVNLEKRKQIIHTFSISQFIALLLTYE